MSLRVGGTKETYNILGKEALAESMKIGLDCELPSDFVQNHTPTMFAAMQKLVTFVTKYKEN